MNLINVIPETIVNDQFFVRNHYVLELLQNLDVNEKFYNFDDPFDIYNANKLQQTAFLQVVTETVFDYPHNNYSEKTWKPIIGLRPFILVSVSGALNDLKSFGFKTFDQWWDESYDNINDPVERLLAITDIISYVADKPKKTLLKILHEMKPVLTHNYNHYYSEFRNHWIDQIHQQCQRNLLPR